MSVALRDLVARLRHDLDRSGRPQLRVTGLRGSAPALCLARVLADRPRPVLAIVPDAAAAEAFAGDLRFYLGDRQAADPLTRRVHHLPGWEIPPFEPLSPARETLAARAEGFHHLLQTPAPVVVATVEALALRHLPRAAFAEAVTYVVAGETIAPDALAARLVEWGYHRVPLVQDPGDLALRGGILDVFPAGHARPVRLEFFGDEVHHHDGVSGTAGVGDDVVPGEVQLFEIAPGTRGRSLTALSHVTTVTTCGRSWVRGSSRRGSGDICARSATEP